MKKHLLLTTALLTANAAMPMNTGLHLPADDLSGGGSGGSTPFDVPAIIRGFLTKDVWEKATQTAWSLFFSDDPNDVRIEKLTAAINQAVESVDDLAALIPQWGPLAKGIVDSAPVDALEATACRTVAEYIVRALKPVAKLHGVQ